MSSVTYTPKLILHRDAKRGETGQYPVWEIRNAFETYYVERRVHPDLVPRAARSVAVGADGTVVCTFDTVKPRPDGRNHRVDPGHVGEHFYITKEAFLASQNAAYQEDDDEDVSDVKAAGSGATAEAQAVY